MLCKGRVSGIQAHTLHFLPTGMHISSNIKSPMLVLPSFLRFFFFFFSFETRRLRGDRSFRPEPLRIPPLEDIEFLDDIQIKIQNMRLKSLTNDQTVPRYRYFNFYKPHKVDGKGFSSQMPTLKIVPSDQKSKRRTCAEECQMPFKLVRNLTFKKM